MKNFRKTGMLTLSTVLSLGIIVPTAGAAALANEPQEQVHFEVAQADPDVTKSDLIKKFKEFFPNQFNFLNNSDFNMDSGDYYPEDDAIRYNLSFHKNIKGKTVHGSMRFRGEDLEIESFYYEPINQADALFPAKITREEAKKTALEFLGKFPKENEYKLETDFNYYSGNQTLTEPIRYSFSFVRTENQVPISDQNVQVTVLGNGGRRSRSMRRSWIRSTRRSSMRTRSGQVDTFADGRLRLNAARTATTGVTSRRSSPRTARAST